MSESASHHASATSGIPQPHGGLGIFRLVTTVITLIVGGGVFTLAGDQAAGGASGAAILTAWSISGIGVLCLVMTFFALSRIKPQLKGGIYSYANAGFGDFLGFNSAWGYWISALLCTVSFSALLFGALSYFFPIFGGGTNLPSVIGASLLIWFYVFLVSRGIKEATGVNAVITISKFVPIFVAITAIIFLQKFDLGIFLANMSQGADPGLPFFDQVSNTMMITIWVFVGIEGAVAISGRAKKERDVGKATIIAFICVLSIYLMVSVLSMGVMPLSELAQLENPALAGVMEHAVGQWGAILINGGVVLSLVGAMLGYTVLSSESPYEAAEQGVFIKAFAKTNKKGAPIVTLVVTNVIIEAFLVVMLFSDSTYQFFYALSAGMILLPCRRRTSRSSRSPSPTRSRARWAAAWCCGAFSACSAWCTASSWRGRRARRVSPSCRFCTRRASSCTSRARRSATSRTSRARWTRWWWPSSSSPPSRRSCCCSPAKWCCRDASCIAWKPRSAS